MPFFMVPGFEAVLPTEINYDSPRVRAYTEEGNQAALEDAIDQLNEARDVALLRCAEYQQALRRYKAQRAPSGVPRLRPRAPTSSRQQGQAQAITTLGGAVHHPRGTPTRDLQDPV
jgi:regulator of sirC expression with transglutaminase-like and TPR domain